MAAASQTSRKTQGRDKELITLITLLVAFIVLLALTFGYVGTQGRYDKQYIERGGELRVLSQRIVKEAEAAISGTGSFALLKQVRDEFEQTLNQLRQGDPKTGLPPSPGEVTASLKALQTDWDRLRTSADIIIGNETLLVSVGQFVGSINDVVPKLSAASEQLVQLFVEKARSATSSEELANLQEQIFLASRQLVLIQRISSNINKVFQSGQGSEVAAQAADLFRHDAAAFIASLEGMREGNAGMKIVRVNDPEARKKLQEISDLFGTITQLDLLILEQFPELFKAQDAAKIMLVNSNTLLQEATKVVDSYAGLEKNRLVSATSGYILGTIALLNLVLLGYKMRRDALARLAVSADQNRRNQEAILRLLDEMADLADGDLTARATVTEDITGAIADAVNYAIDALRGLVTNINQTTVQVSSAAQETQTTAIHLAEASDHQAQQITEASAAINEMAVSIQQVSANAAESASVALGSVSTAGKGASAVQNTIQGMDVIREHIQETSKRIKRLAESSQEIGDIVELINDIADQTNILALNAAIQAAMAGEAGRGFAVVADEVQRLAERSGNATKQIEALVKTIQTDTNEAIISMEQSTSGVVTGARLAQDAGGALSEIENVSTQLAGLIQNISQAARQQSSAAANISDTMNSIQQITTQTSVGSSETAASIGNLAELANELRKSVAGFKLPN
ncbi:MAG TPA: methyl-accepting chemotaxis protein [Gammaproteobacteria bacterium]|nr:methyl-accepting chemotaxis protein [Gammaproteobacteria bacterium]